jgi:mannosyltransferase OCH1-like enzyme
MIPRVIHQVFFDLGKGKLRQIPDFCISYDKTHSYCEQNNIDHKLWNEESFEELLEGYPQYKDLYENFRYGIQKVDFARYLILYDCGGIYLDLDIHPFRQNNIDHLFEKEFWVSRWWDSNLPYNALLASAPNSEVMKEILEHCDWSYKEKSKIKIYDTWKARFVFQTTGHYMIHRVLKKRKLQNDYLPIVSVFNNAKNICVCVPDNKALFYDSSASLWFDGNQHHRKVKS